MRNHHVLSRRKSFFALTLGLTLCGGLSAPFTPLAEAQAATPMVFSSMLAAAPAAASTVPSGAVELSPTPPNDTQSVAPNIVVTFDDSGSMQSNFMGDNRPFDNSSWSGPWRCAGVIDPRITDAADIRSRAMNGVYYNPNVVYSPPVRADGTSFDQADATLTRVPVDGIAVNRPYQTKTLDATGGFNNNASGGTRDSTAATDITGTKNTPKTGWYWDSTKGGSYTDWNNWVYGTYPVGNGYWSSNSQNNPPSRKNDTTNSAYPTLGDKRWTCGYGSSPMDSSKTGLDGKAYPDGGPYYYRYKTTAPAVAVDADGMPTSAGITTLYTSGNWEAVAVPNTVVTIDGVKVNQWQNFANWYAYYRTRFLMTKTSVSRVFGALGSQTPEGAFGSTIRVAWQNLNDGDYKLPTAAIISSLMDANSPACVASGVDPKGVQQPGTAPTAAPNCYRSAFFNWIFQVYGSSTTPNRASTIRAGDFFTRGNGNTGSTGNLRDPYWEPGKAVAKDGNELVCRQNFHMLVTDGYWNEGNPTTPTGFFDVQGTPTLGDAATNFSHVGANKIFWNVPASSTGSCGSDNSTDCYPPLADIAFYYWAKDLRSDLANTVPPYMPDSTSGVTTAGVTSADKTLEAYWNPANDPATWQHLVQYMVTLGVPGKLLYPNELTNLRTGATAWPKPARNAPQAIDDTWHAAVNSRGAYFNAGNPKNLVDQLSEILTNITARNAPAITGAVNTSVLVPGALGFATGYNSADWTGTMQAVGVNADGTTTTSSLWDAGAILDDATKTDPTKRNIFTAKESATDGSFNGGAAFKAPTDLDAAGLALLSDVPASSSSTNDTAQTRIDYLRGDRSKEGTTFRQRTHLLGAIISSQPVYVSYPSSGYRNSWPASSPEQKAIDGDASDCGTTSTCSSYEYFVKNHLTRKPAVYVGANDGMLHAFDASIYEDTSVTPSVVKPTTDAGKELFAYVPRSTYANLGNLTVKDNFKFLPTVDGIPVTRDVFFGAATTTPVSTTAGWHTLLVGGLRLGGRGVYALDITDPDAMSASKVLWEFNADQADQGSWSDGTNTNPGGKPSNLGYTFGQPNIGRLNNGKWVVLVPGGYFPDCSKPPFTAANCSYPAAASNKFSSLFVLDAQTGKLIRELQTPDPTTDSTAVASHGLSSPVLGDYNDDQIDDVAFAGDLDGNLWRYDLTSSDPNKWTISLAYQPTTAGAQPITSMPRLFGDPATNKFIVVFGTGKYLGASDNTSGSASVQAVYGIRDIGSTVTIGTLVAQTLSEKLATDGKTTARGLTNYPVPADKNGWYFNLAPSTTSAGERVVVTPGALFDTGRVVIQTLIPGTNDPCSATIQGAIMVVNAGTGGSDGGLTGPSVGGWGGLLPGDTSTVGGRVDNPRTTGSVPLVTSIGGGTTLIPGLELSGGGGVLNINDAIWRRRSWRALNNDQ